MFLNLRYRKPPNPICVFLRKEIAHEATSTSAQPAATNTTEGPAVTTTSAGGNAE